jgi:hypothetical protein
MFLRGSTENFFPAGHGPSLVIVPLLEFRSNRITRHGLVVGEEVVDSVDHVMSVVVLKNRLVILCDQFRISRVEEPLSDRFDRARFRL